MSATPLKIDFVSDVSCPWCAIGYSALTRALEHMEGEVSAEVHFQPFELNPRMPKGGQEITEHLTQKYGSTREQQAQAREAIRQRGAAVGFTFRMEGRDRIYNTFDAHRLLHWAALEGSGRQPALKLALFNAYFAEGQSPEDHDVLIAAAQQVGLDARRAREVLAGVEFTDEVREAERRYTGAGIHAVPAVIINDQYLISGGQPVEVFENALRQIAAKTAPAVA